MKRVDISKFTRKDNSVLYDSDILLVVKSQNQIARRARMIASKKKKRYGRFTPSATEMGLLVQARLRNNIVEEEWKKEFREPRHIKKLANGNFLLTEINKLLEIDSNGNIISTYCHPFFGYLHTVDVSQDGNRALVVSSGYDALIEIDLKTSKETVSWFAWDHGFNPSEDGIWYTSSKENYKLYRNENKKTLFIDPDEYGEQGVTTANRNAHPNAALYDHSAKNPSAIVSLGHKGLLCRIDLTTANITHLYDNLSVMAHGIYPRKDNGLMITQTTEGEWLWLNRNFEVERIFDFKKIKCELSGIGDSEWIQQVVPVTESKALAIDANRGLIALDIENEMYSVYHADENWCVQDSIIL